MATENCNVKINFLDENYEPTPCKRVVISNGEFRIEFNNVTLIDENVPSSASYRFVWESGGYDTMDQIPLDLNAGKNYEFNFYCLNRNHVVQHERPYVVFEEKDAETDLKWDFDEQENLLDEWISGNEGKKTEVGRWIDTDYSQNPRYAAENCEKEDDDGYSWGVCLPPNAWLNNGASIVSTSTKVRTRFAAIENSKEFVGLRKALYNEHIIDNYKDRPLGFSLKTLEGDNVEQEFVWPQYAVSEGIYKAMPDNLPAEFISTELPIKVRVGKVSIYELYPPKKDEIESFNAYIGAEYYHTRARISSVVHNNEEKEIKVYSSPDGDKTYSIGYFINIVLPAENTVENVFSTKNDGEEIVLNEERDYLINQIENNKVITIRTPINSTKVKLSYQ